jgi:predicted membrane chloride channel (bestrophin family)
MQANVNSMRWLEGRVHWQLIIENSRWLAILLNTHVSCLQLARSGTKMIIANIICSRSIMQEKSDRMWRQELLDVLNEKTVNELMKQPRRLRYLSVLYGFQRLIQVCIEHAILPKHVIRDINPAIYNISKSLGTCNRVRSTNMPWVIAVHLQFMLFVYIAFLPMSLIESSKSTQWEFVSVSKFNYIEIYIYVIIIAYAFFGLSRMALDTNNPFSFSRENHSFGYWGFYEFWCAVEMKNIRTIYGFRTKRTGPREIKGNGLYGKSWASSKIKVFIEKTIGKKLSENHNLYGRTEKIREQLLLSHRSTPKLSNLTLTYTDNEFPSFSFPSCSEDEDTVKYQRKSKNFDFGEQTKTINRNPVVCLSNYNVSLPLSPPKVAKEESILN